MRFFDLWSMSSSNLWKRKVRTILTVLGVVIGTASIVVMISLGLGLSESMMKEIEENGGLTTITVYPGESNTFEEDNTDKLLTGELVETIQDIDHVDVVSPVLNINVIGKYGSYENSYINVMGMTVEALEKMGFELKEGTIPQRDADKLQFLYGNQVLAEFYSSKGGSSYWETGELPDIDLMNDSIFIIFDSDAYWNVQYNDGSAGYGEDSGTPVTPPKKYLVETCGVMAGGPEDYNQYSWNVYCDIDMLTTQLKKVFKNKAIPGQPTTSSGKPYKELYYNSIYVNVDNIDNVTTVQKEIVELGYQAESNMEWVESQQRQYGYIQAVLGGIGAVSMLVAAISITNTMMMSIYERTKEIGIMKVLGCDLRNIQTLFLMEAGFIGLIGGVVGVTLSYCISGVINIVVNKMGTEMQLSYIPFWLATIGVMFAVLVGMAAGFFPSLRAMKLSPLAAIRNE